MMRLPIIRKKVALSMTKLIEMKVNKKEIYMYNMHQC